MRGGIRVNGPAGHAGYRRPGYPAAGMFTGARSPSR